MIKPGKFTKGKYSCNVGSCGDGDCVHDYIAKACPHCGFQLVRVRTNGVEFCSQPEAFVGDRCGYSVYPKPHLKRYANKWHCASEFEKGFSVGDSPAQALAFWQKMHLISQKSLKSAKSSL